MQHKFFPHTDEDLKVMMKKVGINSLEELYAEVPKDIRFQGEYDIPSMKSELELRQYFSSLGQKNNQLTIFAGGGVYDHYTPSVVPNLVSRSEFLTSYTPYQAEISQGTLHYIFEFQSMMAELTGMDVSNASMYDGSTATAEAVLMAFANSKKADTVLVSSTIDPKTLRVINTLAHFHGVKIEMVDAKNGATDVEDMKAKLAKGNAAGMVVQQPNYYGVIEDYGGFADACHENKALFIMNANPADITVLKTPKEWGADIAVGDGQSLGIPMNFGGPYVGYLCTSKKLIRKMPGRIVGATTDMEGKRTFVLTLQAREQHIRREKATSNICSNESLMALYVTVYMALMGKEGLREVNELGYSGAHYLAEKLCELKGFSMAFPDKPFLNEFAVKYDGDIDELQNVLLDYNGVQLGLKIADHILLLCVTETISKDELDEVILTCKAYTEGEDEDE